jgi:hypothetical protein
MNDSKKAQNELPDPNDQTKHHAIGLFPKEGANAYGASVAWLDNQGPLNPNGGFRHQEDMGIAAQIQGLVRSNGKGFSEDQGVRILAVQDRRKQQSQQKA